MWPRGIRCFSTHQSSPAARRSVQATMSRALLLAVCLALLACAASACDRACQCKKAGGEWRPARGPILATCRVYYNVDGRSRYAQVYLPPSYDGSKRFPMWVQLHGLFWLTMAGIGQQVGRINATDITPTWDRIVSNFGNNAIIVYPQSLGNPGTGAPSEGQGTKFRQGWNVPFWRCQGAVCAENVNDVKFIETVIQDMQRRFAVKKGQVLLTGASAGGMMVETLLCQSGATKSSLAAAVNVLGGIGRDFSGSCSGSNVNYLKIHGMEDGSIYYDKDVLVDGVSFLSAVELGRWRGQKAGCFGGDWGPVKDDGTQRCINHCAKKPGKGIVRQCGIKGAGHTTDLPYPGWVWQQAWMFFNEAMSKRGDSYRLPSGRRH